MRTFIAATERDQTGKKELYKTRASTEWDLSFTFPDNALYMPNSMIVTIEDFIRKHPDQVKYALISGIEVGTNADSLTTHNAHHVHCCLIIKDAMTRDQALQVFELPEVYAHNKFKHYAVPRNQTWPYIGWKLHHIKKDTKIDPNSLILYEYGQLPEDNWLNPDMKRKVTVMRRKFETDYTPARKGPAPVPKPIKTKEVKELKKRALTKRQIYFIRKNKK